MDKEKELQEFFENYYIGGDIMKRGMNFPLFLTLFLITKLVEYTFFDNSMFLLSYLVVVIYGISFVIAYWNEKRKSSYLIIVLLVSGILIQYIP